MFDVGYGDAVLVSSGTTDVLFDTGPEGTPLASRLRALGIDRIELLVLSHPHPDHFAGLGALTDDGIEIDRVVHNPDPGWAKVEVLRTLPAGVVDARAPSFEVGPFVLTAIHPGAGVHADPNDRSLALHIESAAFSALFPGDVVDGALQAEWCARLPERLDLLKLPHHGDHLARCLGDRAQVLLLSVGENPWGVPRTETLERYGDRIRRTDREGELTLRFPEGSRARPRSPPPQGAR